jgi:hypothetical protein
MRLKHHFLLLFVLYILWPRWRFLTTVVLCLCFTLFFLFLASCALFLLILFLLLFVRSLSQNGFLCVCRPDVQPNFLHLLGCFNETVSYVGRSHYSPWALPSRKDHGGDACLVYPLTVLPLHCLCVHCFLKKGAETPETLNVLHF